MARRFGRLARWARDGQYFVGAVPVDAGTWHQIRMQEREREENAARDAELHAMTQTAPAH